MQATGAIEQPRRSREALTRSLLPQQDAFNNVIRSFAGDIPMSYTTGVTASQSYTVNEAMSKQ
jgi:hypothetical protein